MKDHLIESKYSVYFLLFLFNISNALGALPQVSAEVPRYMQTLNRVPRVRTEPTKPDRGPLKLPSEALKRGRTVAGDSPTCLPSRPTTTITVSLPALPRLDKKQFLTECGAPYIVKEAFEIKLGEEPIVHTYKTINLKLLKQEVTEWRELTQFILTLYRLDERSLEDVVSKGLLAKLSEATKRRLEQLLRSAEKPKSTGESFLTLERLKKLKRSMIRLSFNPAVWRDSNDILEYLAAYFESAPEKSSELISDIKLVCDQLGHLQGIAQMGSVKYLKGHTEGFLNIHLLATSPTNLPLISGYLFPKVHLGGVGTFAVKMAIDESRARSLEGRVSLVALESAAGFYQKLSMRTYYPDGLSGLTEGDPSYYLDQEGVENFEQAFLED